MRARRGCGAIIGIVLLALLATVGYTAYAGTAVYRQLDSGRQELVAAQASMTVAARSADPVQLVSTATAQTPARLARGFRRVETSRSTWFSSCQQNCWQSRLRCPDALDSTRESR